MPTELNSGTDVPSMANRIKRVSFLTQCINMPIPLRFTITIHVMENLYVVWVYVSVCVCIMITYANGG